MGKKYFIYLLLIITMGVGIILSSGSSLYLFVDIPSILLVLLITIFGLLMNYPTEKIGHYFVLGISKTELTADEKKYGKNFFSYILKLVIFSAVIGSLTGIMITLANINDPSQVGKWLASSLLTTFYALFIITAIVIPFQQRFMR